MKEVLRLSRPISWLDGVDPESGRIIQEGHPDKGKSIADKIVVIPYSTGSTVGAYTFFKLVRAGKQPMKIILEHPDSVTISAELAGIPVEVPRAKKAYKLKEDAPEEFLRFLEKEASITDSEGFVRIKSVHVSGISYTTIGDAGLEFLEDIASRGIVVKVKSTSNPAGMDLIRWKEMGIPESYAEKQLRIVRCLLSIGVLPSFTCTPYIAGNRPNKEDHICWGESSAVAYVNSVIGARTNREGSVKTLVAAVVGLTPKYGMHLEENRRPDLIVSLERGFRPRGRTELGALAYYVGKLAPNSVPIYEGILRVSEEELKAMSAGGAASGKIELFHIKGITPEASLPYKEGCKRIRVGRRELLEVMESLNTSGSRPELVAIGCPHLSEAELRRVAKILEGRRVKIPLWLFTSRQVFEKCADLCRSIERSEARVFCDTCMVVCPLRDLGYSVVATDSAKAAMYLHSLQGLEVIFDELDSLVKLCIA